MYKLPEGSSEARRPRYQKRTTPRTLLITGLNIHAELSSARPPTIRKREKLIVIQISRHSWIFLLIRVNPYDTTHPMQYQCHV